MLTFLISRLFLSVLLLSGISVAEIPCNTQVDSGSSLRVIKRQSDIPCSFKFTVEPREDLELSIKYKTIQPVDR